MTGFKFTGRESKCFLLPIGIDHCHYDLQDVAKCQARRAFDCLLELFN